MSKLVMMPPQNELQQQWARRLEQTLPQYHVVHNIVNKAAWY
jgi:hypothetical protein